MRKPPDDMRSADAVRQFGETVRKDFRGWWNDTGVDGFPDELRTYYGRQPAHKVLERTCWHSAQHCRQLMVVLQQLDIEPDGPLGATELDGLPLPEQTWDSEVPFD